MISFLVRHHFSSACRLNMPNARIHFRNVTFDETKQNNQGKTIKYHNIIYYNFHF